MVQFSDALQNGIIILPKKMNNKRFKHYNTQNDTHDNA